MLKSVVQALPVYTMSCFRLPKGLCQQLSKQIAQFWWSNGEKDRKLHWVAWNKMTEPKETGGLGFKDLEAFNLALLAKQVWRIITKPNLLVSKVLKHKYFPHTSIFQASSKPRDSWLWKSWLGTTNMIREGSSWQVGNGKTIKIWEDKWILEG